MTSVSLPTTIAKDSSSLKTVVKTMACLETVPTLKRFALKCRNFSCSSNNSSICDIYERSGKLILTG